MRQIFILSVIIIGWSVCIGAKTAQNYTSIKTDGGCKLYMKNMKFTKTMTKGTLKQVSQVVDIGSSHLETVAGSCANRTGTIQLDYSNLPDTKGELAIESLKIIWYLTYSPQYQWWQVVSLELYVQGEITGGTQLEANWTGSLMQSVAIGAPKMFSYACSKPDRLTYFLTEGDKRTSFALHFENMHLQPFEWTRGRHAGGFTDNVDDCMAFFSAGAWMTILTALVLLSVLLFGVVMIGNMSTVNRFDDPKAKGINIAERE